MSLKRIRAIAAAALAATFIAPVPAQAFQPPTPQSFIHNCAPKQVVVVPGGANTNPFMPDKLPIGLITGDVGTQLGNRADTDVISPISPIVSLQHHIHKPPLMAIPRHLIPLRVSRMIVQTARLAL